jgi:hypothetical protein
MLFHRAEAHHPVDAVRDAEFILGAAADPLSLPQCGEAQRALLVGQSPKQRLPVLGGHRLGGHGPYDEWKFAPVADAQSVPDPRDMDEPVQFRCVRMADRRGGAAGGALPLVVQVALQPRDAAQVGDELLHLLKCVFAEEEDAEVVVVVVLRPARERSGEGPIRPVVAQGLLGVAEDDGGANPALPHEVVEHHHTVLVGQCDGCGVHGTGVVGGRPGPVP